MMHVRYSITRLLLGLCFLALAPVQVAHAGFDGGHWSTGHYVDWDTGVTHTTSQWNPGGAPASGNTRWGTSGGVPAASSVGRLPVGKGYIDVEARVVPSRPSVAAAIGKFGRKFGFIGQAYAVMELAQELGYIYNASTDSFTQSGGTTLSDVPTCASTYAAGPVGTLIYVPSLNYTYQVQYPPGAGGPTLGANWVSVDSCTFNVWPNVNGYGARIYRDSGDQRPQIPKTWDQFETAIETKTNWPADSKLPAALKEAADSGEPIEASSPTVTGPSSVTEPVTTTTNPDGTTVTKTVTHNVTYNGNTINYTTTTVINNNGQITTETKDGEPPTDQCERYPNSVGCADLDTPDSDVLEKKTHAVTVEAVSFASSSVCPSPLSFTVRGSSYGVSYQPLCDRLEILKTLFLALAAVLAAFIVADSFRVT